MSFVSLGFVLFMAAVVAIYFAVPKNGRWIVLLVASYVFFFLNSEWLVLVLFGQTLATYLVGRRIAQEDKARIKRYLALGIAVNLGALLFLKYYNFFAGSANRLLALLGVQLPSLGLVVPIGISFYTLQTIAYLVDLKRGKIEADASLPKFMLFMSYFPQILQGPIPRYSQLAHQLYEGHGFEYDRFKFGVQLILWGFFKKLVIADRLAIPVGQIFDNYMFYDGPIVFLAALGYGLQLYADFSGGIDIARGFSQAIGIELVDNFRQPYFACSLEDFWRRWHITLGGWMRDYVFYPLSLSKRLNAFRKRASGVVGPKIGKKIPVAIATFVTFFLIGFWHGASWKFVAYGLWNACIITAGVMFGGAYAGALKKLRVNEKAFSWRLFQMMRTVCIVAVGRLFTRAVGAKAGLAMAVSMTVNWFDWTFLLDGTMINLGLSNAEWWVLATGVLIMLAVDIAHERGFAIREALSRQNFAFRWLVYLMAFTVVIVMGVYGQGYDASAFIYQRY